MKTSELKNIGILCVYVVVFFIIYLFCNDAIWLGDDTIYQYNFATGTRITSVSEIFQSQNAHWVSTNGRYVAHWLCQLFLAILGKNIFAIANGIMYLVFINLIMLISKSKVRDFKNVLTATILVLLLANTQYEPNCQIGYIWMTSLILLFLCVFFFVSDKKSNPLVVLLLFVLAVIAGNAHEAINIGIGGALAIYAIRKLKSLSISQWVMVVGFGIGALLLCLSPGIIRRSQATSYPLLYSILMILFSLRVTYLYIGLLVYKIACKKISIIDYYRDNSFFINALVILLFFNVFIGVGGNRQLFGIEVISCILFIKLLKTHNFNLIGYIILGIIVIWGKVLDFVSMGMGKQLYEPVMSQVKAGAKVIYFDFPKCPLFVNPNWNMTNVLNERYLFYSFWVEANQTREDTADSWSLVGYPIQFKNIIEGEVKNQVLEYYPGSYMLIQDRNNPCAFVIKRHLDFMGINITLPDATMTFGSSQYSTDHYDVFYEQRLFPFIITDTVEILE